MATSRTLHRWLVASAVLVGLAALAPAPPAAAHARLVSSVPAASSVLGSGPDRIVLQFDEAIESRTASIQLFDQTFTRIVLGVPAKSPSDDTVITATVPSIGKGTFAVVWRATSVDGHVVDGAFSFQVGNASSDGAALVEHVRQGVQSPPIVRRMYGAARALGYLGLALLIGGGLMAIGLDDERRARLRGWLLSAWLVSFVATAAAAGLYGATVVAGGLSDVVSPDVWTSLGDTQTGRVLLIRLALVLWLGALVRDLRLSAAALWRALALIAVVGVVLTFPMAGHDATLSPVPLWAGLGALHTTAVFLWLGGLMVMTVASTTWFAGEAPVTAAAGLEPAVDEAVSEEAVSEEAASDDPASAEAEAELPEGGQAEPEDPLAPVVRRFSAVAFVAVPVIVATGALETVKLAGGLGDLTATAWGRILLVKVAVAAVVISIGGVSRWLLHERGLSSIRRTVAVEALLGIVVVSLAAAFVALPPRAAPASQVFTTSLTQNGLIADITLTPGQVGANEVHLVLTPPGGSLQPVVGVTGRMLLPSRDIPESPITITPDGSNHWTGRITLPYSGDWTLELIVEVTKGATQLLSTTVHVP